MNKTILILGGYGNFGRLIAENLAQRPDIELIISGRSLSKAKSLCEQMQGKLAGVSLRPVSIDIDSPSLPQELNELQPGITIHTSGPFQGQDYRVPSACITAGSHYIDLADDRRFVCDFYTLDQKAKDANVIAITGASSVPGLSSVAIDMLAGKFSRIDEIDYCIVPGSNVELGEATLKGILSYIGRPFQGWQQNKANDIYGWLDLRRMEFGDPLGKRWLANVDIPDLELFPQRYQGVETLRFQAGHELGIAHLSIALMAYMSKLKLFGHWEKYSAFFYRLRRIIKVLGSDTGGMVIRLEGLDHDSRPLSVTWKLIAKDGVGPFIPTISTLILTNAILDGRLTETGARPCLGMYRLDEFFDIASKWDIYSLLEENNG